MTLIEIALAMAILVMIGSLTYGSIGRSFEAYETVKEIDSRYHNIRVAMNRMAREFSSAFLSARTNHKGLEQRWETIFKSTSSASFDEVHFTSFAHQILRANAKESDQCEISYFGKSDPDNPKQMNLMRREDPRLDSDPDKGGRSYVLAENIKKFKLRFFNPQNDDWTDEWDTEDAEFQGRLPTLVEIKMIIESEDGDDLTFVTKTRVNLPRELRL